MNRLSAVILLGVLVSAGVLYWPGMHGGFVFDDFPNLVANEVLRASELSLASLRDAALSSESGPLARPMAMLTFALQIVLTGESVFALKVGNLGIHLANGMLVFLLARRIVHSTHQLSGPPMGASLLPICVTAAWLLAPINLTAVLYVVQRMESLSAMWVLLGLLGYLHGRQLYARGEGAGLAWMVTSILIGTVLAALSKETGILLPAFAFVLEWALFGLHRPDGTQVDAKLALLFLLTLLLPGVIGVAATLPAAVNGASYAGRTFSLAERLLTESRVVLDYARWIVLPDLQDLSLYHDDYPLSRGWLSPPTTLFAVCAIVVATISAALLRKRRPLVAAGILFFLTGHSLVSTYLPLELVFEHRNYLPSFGIFLALFDLLLVYPTQRLLRVAGLSLSAGLVSLSGFVLHLRASEWSAPATLALSESSRHPESVRANYELGRMFAERTTDPGSRPTVLRSRPSSRLPDCPARGCCRFRQASRWRQNSASQWPPNSGTGWASWLPTAPCPTRMSPRCTR